jgi:hypothetical protein
MDYFTPQLFLQLNSQDARTVDKAMVKWEQGLVSYKKRLKRIRSKMPIDAKRLSELSLHDWDVLQIDFGNENDSAEGDFREVLIVLQSAQNLAILRYSLHGDPGICSAPEKWPLSKKRVHWLYDELNTNENGRKAFVHHILLSDGTTLVVPFLKCRVSQAKSDHAISHSEVMQIA